MPNSFQDLQIWQDARELMVKLYKLTSKFPKEEVYNLTSQIRRASISIMANIAEGHSRSTHLDRIRFLTMSRGSLEEIKSHLAAALSLTYINQSSFHQLDEQLTQLAKRINSFIRSLKEQHNY